MSPDDSLNTLFPLLAETNLPLPVIDENRRLLGIVVRGSVLAGLADAGATND